MTKEAILLPKMTLKSICGMTRQTSEEDTKKYFLTKAKDSAEVAVIAGYADGFSTKAGAKGESTFFSGLFLAQNRESGVNFKSYKLFLPKSATDIIVAQLKNRANGQDEVKFKLVVRVVEDSSSAAGYTYICEPVKTPELLNKEMELMQTFLALPAPSRKKSA